ncbi:MAG TPA: hypothetical protein VFG50_08615, partial [Rhodothermales bacterium]|nr:hypothetical protein [Rhodothermales bacterium]
LGGDELSRTQGGNNNAYCQDNETNWYDWQLDERESGFLAFVQKMIAFRRHHQNFRRKNFMTGEADENGTKDVRWWHPAGREMKPEDWGRQDELAFGMLLRGDCIRGLDVEGDSLSDGTFFLLFNAWSGPVEFVLPHEQAGGPRGWRVDRDGSDAADAELKPGDRYTATPHSLTTLVAEFEPGEGGTEAREDGSGDGRKHARKRKARVKKQAS